MGFYYSEKIEGVRCYQINTNDDLIIIFELVNDYTKEKANELYQKLDKNKKYLFQIYVETSCTLEKDLPLHMSWIRVEPEIIFN